MDAEVVLVAQDLAAYGRDIDAPGGLPDLLGFIGGTGGLKRIRLLYLHPREVNDHLLSVGPHSGQSGAGGKG